jgi:hypothetical protein
MSDIHRISRIDYMNIIVAKANPPDVKDPGS